MTQEINQNKLRFFSNVYQCGSINNAAERLNISASVIILQIQTLEEELGTKLFAYKKQGQELLFTEEADLVFEHYQRCQVSQESLKAELQEKRKTELKNIYISVGKPYCEFLQKEVLNYFYSQYPDINIQIKEANTADQVIAEISDNEAHIGIMAHNFLLEQSPNVNYYTHISLPIYFAVNGRHPFCNKKKITLSEIQNYPLVLPPPSFTLRKVIQSVEKSEHIQLNSRFVSDSFSAWKNFCVDYDSGGAFMSALPVKQESMENRLSMVELDHPAFNSLELCIISRRNKPLTPPLNKMLRLISEKATSALQKAV